MQPVYGELNSFIRDYGKEHGYDMIWGATSSGNIVYAREAVNLTEDVLKYIENKREKDTPKQTK